MPLGKKSLPMRLHIVMAGEEELGSLEGIAVAIDNENLSSFLLNAPIISFSDLLH
jgi:hypothetical protein